MNDEGKNIKSNLDLLRIIYGISYVIGFQKLSEGFPNPFFTLESTFAVFVAIVLISVIGPLLLGGG